MYRPLGLSCGHKFCTPCMVAVLGRGKVLLRPIRWLLAHVPPTETCPVCRRANVFSTAMELKLLGQLIQADDPKEWKRREAEFKAQMAAVKKERDREEMMLLARAYGI